MEAVTSCIGMWERLISGESVEYIASSYCYGGRSAMGGYTMAEQLMSVRQNGGTMRIESVESRVNRKGVAIEEINLIESVFDTITVQREGEGEVIVEAEYADGSGDVKTERFEIVEEVYYGLDNKIKDKRDVEDDMQDALNAVGYAVVNKNE
jgi:hypothetical protein